MTRSQLGRVALQLGGAATLLALLAWTFRDVRAADVLALLARVGPAGALSIFVPQLLSAAIETWGWRRGFGLLGARASFGTLFRVRLATDGVATCLPAGALWAETLKLPLLAQSGLSASSAGAGILCRKYLLLTSQALYIAAAGIGAIALGVPSPSWLRGASLAALLLPAALVVALAAASLRVLLSRGRVASRVQAAISRLPFRRARELTARASAHCGEADRCLRRFFEAPPAAEARATGWFLGGWALEAVETFWILHLLGVRLDFATVASFEVGLSLLRSLVFVLPAGLGVQDAGYVLFLSGLGVPDALAVGAAFLVLKRSKELVFGGAGLALLALSARAPSAPVPAFDHQPVCTP